MYQDMDQEEKMLIVLIFIQFIFASRFMITGYILCNAPKKYGEDHVFRYPQYDSKLASSDEKRWDAAQRVYGRLIVIFGVIYILASMVTDFIEVMFGFENGVIVILIICFLAVLLVFMIASHFYVDSRIAKL